MEAKLRRYQTLVKTLGLGTLAFGIWNILKTIIYNIINPTSETSDSSDLILNETNETALIVIFFLLIAVLIIDILMRIFVFFSTRRVSAGKSKGILCIIVSSIMAISYGISVPLDVLNLGYSSKTITDSIATIILDTTAFMISIGVIYATIKIINIKKKLNTQREAK